ncbi:MAG: hypothetical protein IKI11_04935 [Neisseriaceae bacterium]|nr:hypothetical protein [Neisseriaceae bacterium]
MELLEILFDKIDIKHGVDFVKKVSSNSEKITKINSNIYPDLTVDNYQNFTFKSKDNGTVYFQFKNTQLFDYYFKYFEIIIVIIENDIELNIWLDSEETKNIHLNDFILFCQEIAKDLNTPFYYCGIEPAYDKNTQFFSYLGINAQCCW